MGNLVRDTLRDTLDAIHFRRDRKTGSEKPIETAVLFLYADKERYPDAEERMMEVFEWHDGFRFTYVGIDNFHPDKKTTQKADNHFDLGGDNTWWEFSGWRKGVQSLETLDLHPQAVVCINDAFLNYADRGYDRRHYRRIFRPAVLRHADTAMVGRIDRANERHELDGRDVSSWVKSNFYALPYEVALGHLGPHLTRETADLLFDEEWEGRVFRPGSPCNQALQVFLTHWITTRWQWGSAPDSSKWPVLKMKLISIFNERLLTWSIRNAGVEIVDTPNLRWWQVPPSNIDRS